MITHRVMCPRFVQLMFLEPTEQMPVNEAAASALANPEVFREQVKLLKGADYYLVARPRSRELTADFLHAKLVG